MSSTKDKHRVILSIYNTMSRWLISFLHIKWISRLQHKWECVNVTALLSIITMDSVLTWWLTSWTHPHFFSSKTSWVGNPGWYFLFKPKKHLIYSLQAGNILIDSNGTIKLADFGVSACMFDTGDRQRSRNTFVGTPCWYASFPALVLLSCCLSPFHP